MQHTNTKSRKKSAIMSWQYNMKAGMFAHKSKQKCTRNITKCKYCRKNIKPFHFISWKYPVSNVFKKTVTHPYVVPNLYDFLLQGNTKDYILAHALQTTLDPLTFMAWTWKNPILCSTEKRNALLGQNVSCCAPNTNSFQMFPQYSLWFKTEKHKVPK